MERSFRNGAAVLFFLVLFLLPLVNGDSYVRHVSIIAIMYAVLVSSWNISLGYGGVFGFADTIGIDRFTSECEALAARYGPRFRPPETLTAMAKDGRRFHAV